MKLTEVMRLWLLWFGGFFVGLGIGQLRAAFYRAYFAQKQRNAGRDPKAVLRAEFPLIWWLL